MGTSTSSKGANGQSPLVPSWANDDNEQIPNIERNLGGFRTELGKAANTPFTQPNTHLYKALGHYAKSATGGSLVGPKRYQKMIKAGGSLFNALQNIQAGKDYLGLKLSEIIGQPIDIVIDKIIETILELGGDSERIRASLNQALAKCLDGLEEFDFTQIPDELIIDLMLSYTEEFLFQQIMLDSKASFDKADTPENLLELENDLHALIESAVDKHMSNKLRDSTDVLTRKDIEDIQKTALKEIWIEWEEYLDD